jgi:hypothetical protein
MTAVEAATADRSLHTPDLGGKADTFRASTGLRMCQGIITAMELGMRLLMRFAGFVFSTTFLLVMIGSALAQGYPTKPITLIVPFPAAPLTS